jgi:hypothetical protein
MLVAALFAVSVPSFAGGVGVTGYKWQKMTDQNQRIYVDGVLDGFLFSYGMTGDPALGWADKYVGGTMDMDLVMRHITKYFDTHQDQVHNVMVAVIKDALENGVPDVEKVTDEYDGPIGEVPIMGDR